MLCKEIESMVFIFDPSSPQQNKIYLFHSHIINRLVSEPSNFEFLVGPDYRKRKFLDKSQKWEYSIGEQLIIRMFASDQFINSTWI